MSKKLLGIIIPTNEPNTAFTHLIPSLVNIVDAKEYIELLFNFQSPWTIDEINQVVNACKELDLGMKYVYSTYDISKGVPIVKIRNDTMMIDDSLKFYMFADDDMIFREASSTVNRSYGEQVLDAIHYMLIHEDCGEIIFSGQLFRRIPTNSIGPTELVSPYMTGRGLLFRSLDKSEGQLFPNDSLDLLGAGEEKLLSAYRLSKGLYPARLRCARCSHYEYHNYNGTKNNHLKVVPGTVEYNWTNDEYSNNIGKYIKSHYNVDGMKDDFKVINDEDFKGINVYDPIIVKNYTDDYNDIDLVKVKSMIDNLIKE